MLSDMMPCQLQSYWDECERSDPECKNFLSNQELAMLPARVLDISRVERRSEVKLYITEEKEQSKYIALSYCWGGPQHLTTTIKLYRSDRVVSHYHPYRGLY
jgi:hypothetical protein